MFALFESFVYRNAAHWTLSKLASCAKNSSVILKGYCEAI